MRNLLATLLFLFVGFGFVSCSPEEDTPVVTNQDDGDDNPGTTPETKTVSFNVYTPYNFSDVVPHHGKSNHQIDTTSNFTPNEINIPNNINWGWDDFSKNLYEPTLPKKFTAYFVASETTDKYDKGEIVHTQEVELGYNKIENLPTIKYVIHVTNYYDSPNKHWFVEYAYPIIELPQVSDRIYLYDSVEVDYASVVTGGIQMRCNYMTYAIYKGSEINNIPYTYFTDDDGVVKTQEFYDLDERYYVQFIRRDYRYILIRISQYHDIEAIRGSTFVFCMYAKTHGKNSDIKKYGYFEFL